MSDFDKIIHDHLNEDDGEYFPRRELNWDRLATRLDDFEAANPLPIETPMPVLRPVWRRWAWSSAAAALIGVSGVLFWHYNRMQDENKRLQQEIVDLKQQGQQSSNTALGQKTDAQTDQSLVQPSTKPSELAQSPNAQNPTIAPNSANQTTETTPSVLGSKNDKKQGNLTENRQNAAIVDVKPSASNKEVSKKEAVKNEAVQKKTNSQLTQLEQNKKLNNVLFDKKNEPLQQQKANLNEVLVNQSTPSVSPAQLEANKAKTSGIKQNDVAIAPKDENTNIGNVDKKDLEKVETTAQTPPSVTPPVSDKNETVQTAQADVKTETAATVTDTKNIEKAKQDSISKALVAQQETKSNAESAANPIIKTDKVWKKLLPKGLAVGLHGAYGSMLPEMPGVEATQGKGVNLELMLTKNIGLTAQADLLETEFEVRERPRHFHVKKEPNPPKPNLALHSIKGDRHSRMLSLNVKYVLTDKLWLQPSITVGHTWRKFEESPVKFVYKDITTGDAAPEEVVTEVETMKNLWQVGIGLEKKVKRWTFGVSADLQKDFAAPKDINGNTMASNFGILRGGVKFNIF